MIYVYFNMACIYQAKGSRDLTLKYLEASAFALSKRAVVVPNNPPLTIACKMTTGRMLAHMNLQLSSLLLEEEAFDQA